LNWQHLATIPTLAELVPSGFSVHNNGFCGGPNTFSQEKHQSCYLERVAFVTSKVINIKLNPTLIADVTIQVRGSATACEANNP